MSVQAGFGRYVALSDPATANTTLGVIADTSHEALTEMRRLLSILRIEAHEEDEGRYLTMPRLSELESLVKRVRPAGLDVGLSVEGRPVELPPGLDQCAYRIVQESLTNVLKHAAASRAEVHLAYAPGTLTLRVTDDGTGPSTGPAAGSGHGGHGLIGMTERVRLYQGTITAGGRPGGGFEVLVTFPVPLPQRQGEPEAG
ncbi:sensor histidine kinase [Nonomuraea sp. CA-143628]|uniref:sensor histidine kinase n=1 Tax=Nonomuraea sp. CA-143628 TaxID=3239997 RepID=UPI003D89B6E1